MPVYFLGPCLVLSGMLAWVISLSYSSIYEHPLPPHWAQPVHGSYHGYGLVQQDYQEYPLYEEAAHDSYFGMAEPYSSAPDNCLSEWEYRYVLHCHCEPPLYIALLLLGFTNVMWPQFMFERNSLYCFRHVSLFSFPPKSFQGVCAWSRWAFFMCIIMCLIKMRFLHVYHCILAFEMRGNTWQGR